MPQSLACNLVHVIFSTKNRKPLLTDSIRSDLHDYAGGILRDLKSPALIMNSVNDHIHLLLNLHRTKALSDVIMELKRGTSLWVKEKDPTLADFYWQSGFGAFSIGKSMVPDVSLYIKNQAEHHKELSYQDELRLFLRRYEIEFDERYVWD
jgi:putative transposase